MEPDIEIVAPDGTTVKFPAGTPDEEILRVMQENFGGPEDSAYYAEPGMTEDNPIDLATVDRATAAGLTQGTWVKGADGTVYALPSPPTEGQVRVGDEPLAQGVYQRPFAVAEDIAKSIPTGIVEGATGIAGMQGTLGQLIGGQPGQYIPGFGIVGPTGEQLNDELRQSLGRDYYQPQSVAGEYARTAGEFLPGLIAPGGAGAKAASWLVPAAASETAGQLARALGGGERGTGAEGIARLAGGLGGGLAVGGVNAIRSGADNVLRGAAEGVTPEQLNLAAALRARSPVPLTNAEALQQVTGGATGMGRVQRVVEGASPRLAPMMANRPDRVEQAIGGVLDQIAPPVPAPQVAGQAQEAAAGVLDTMRRRVNESAQPFYDRLPGQSLPPEQAQQLLDNPSYAAALNAVRRDPELSPLLSAELPMDEATRMLRARQQGFTTEGYRGAAGDAPLFSNSREAQRVGTFFTSDPAVASTYAPTRGGAVFPVLARESRSVVADGRGNNWARLSQDTPIQTPEIRVSRAEDNDLLEALGQPRGADFGTRPAGQTTAGDVAGSIGDYVSTDRLAEWARRQGFGGLRTNNVIDVADSTQTVAPSNVSTVFSADDLRSRFDAFPAPTPDNDLNVINRVVQQLDTMESQARPGAMNPGGNNTLAAERSRAAALARQLAGEASPDFATARQTVATGREAFVDPLRRGPIGAIAGQSDVQPNLAGQTRALFPAQPFEGQADETAQALRLMGEVDPSVPGPLVRQFLAQQAAEAGQANVGGANPFGGAKFAAQTFGNSLQRETVLGAVDAAAPMASRDVRDLVEALAATGQREPAGSNTSFNTQMLQDLRGGNAATGAAQGVTNPLGIPGKIAGMVDDWTARRNAETLADLLVANSDEFSARLTRAINRPRGANRIRTATAVGAGQED